MKKMSIFVLTTIMVMAQSCSSDLKEYGIETVIEFGNGKAVILFNHESCSGLIWSYMEKEGYRSMTMTELTSLLKGATDVPTVQNLILKKVAKVMQSDKYYQPTWGCPFFQSVKGKLFADDGEFLSGWSEYGYFFVVKGIEKKVVRRNKQGQRLME
jgi:hypothetical protein